MKWRLATRTLRLDVITETSFTRHLFSITGVFREEAMGSNGLNLWRILDTKNKHRV